MLNQVSHFTTLHIDHIQVTRIPIVNHFQHKLPFKIDCLTVQLVLFMPGSVFNNRYRPEVSVTLLVSTSLMGVVENVFVIFFLIFLRRGRETRGSEEGRGERVRT